MGSLCKLVVPAVSLNTKGTDRILLALALPTCVPDKLTIYMNAYTMQTASHYSQVSNTLYMNNLGLHFQFVLRTLLGSTAVLRTPNAHKTPNFLQLYISISY